MRAPFAQEQPGTVETPQTACGQYRWSVAILSSRENSHTLRATIAAAVAALGDEPAVVDVLVNGNEAVAHEVAGALAAERSTTSPVAIRAWSVALGDKAHAWNQYVHDVWPGAEHTFFVDGYARVQPEAFRLLSAGLTASPEALAAAGVPTVGRSAARLRAWMIAAPQINGSLYALRGDTVVRLRDQRFRIPLGLYRVDALIGSALNYNLCPAVHTWCDSRITVTAGATWLRRVESVWTHKDRLTILGRMIRQAFARFEERAIKEHLVQLHASPMRLPETALDFVEGWIRRHPVRAVAMMMRRPLALVGWVQLRRRADWHLRAMPPERMF